MSGIYSALGGVFEYFNDDCGYDKWSQYLIERINSLGVKPCARGVDAGCGNGYFTRAFERAGYGMTGVDISPEMLNAAVELSRKNGLKSQYILGDIAKLSLNFKPDFIIAANDCVNYLPQNGLTATFKRLYGLLKRGGALIFDISSSHKLRHILGDNAFADDRDGATCVWFTKLCGDRVELDITVYVRRADGLYERRDESQTQFIHEENAVVAALLATGFSVTVEGVLGGNDKSERINFICVKR